MLTNHAESIRQSGAESCAYCHQPVYCARCHSEKVLPGSAPPVGTGLMEAPPGVHWPLIAVADRQ